MKTIQNIIVLGAFFLFSLTSCEAQIKNAKTETLKVSGNCGMCKKRIETAVNSKDKVAATWDADTQLLSVTYDSKATNRKEILTKVAAVGHDNELEKAPDAVYNKLHGCCKYERATTSGK